MSHNNENLDRIAEHLREELDPGEWTVLTARRLGKETGMSGHEAGFWLGRLNGSRDGVEQAHVDGLEVSKWRKDAVPLKWLIERVAEDDAGREHVVADGGVRWLDLTGFQQQLVKAVIEFENQEGESPYGVQVKRSLSEWYGHEVSNAQIYPNIDDLVDMGVLDREPLDKRTKAVQSTPLARQMLAGEAEHMAHVAGLELAEAVADGGEEQ
ncbi:DNA-binding protein [Haloferax sp. Atlit-10N]|uniref:DNA-binding protein n=1 Tax=unclassified Haloferax TaxID=2625095 RepID=UPI000E2667A3|nr:MULTISPECIES: DNA-binding protein [unclassified Haloferax]RDZ39396.1 DNA-binding protein [Haloferax sp. Atlit-16N]RDZ53911.1 DNA-binding protein [Haloferax sp. Atlit-10N]